MSVLAWAVMRPRLLAFCPIARIVAVLGLSVSPSQSAPDQRAAPVSTSSSAFTAYAHKTLAGDTKAQSLRSQALNQALEQQLLQQAEQAISPGAVSAHYERYREYFKQPEAIALWRLLAGSEAQAKDLLDKILKSADRAKTWTALVREHSLDKATHFRRGSLGYVWPDGNTDVPQVRVASVLYEAAQALKDGELMAQPVREGQHWAIIWRRDSRKAKGQSLEQAQAQIRQQLTLAQARSAHHALVQDLRSKHLSEYHPEALDSFTPSPEAPVEAHRTPVVARPAAKSPVPHQTDRGER